MKEPYYTISEASERVGVESHVLRYWEEELKMDIHRNQMGHRYYTEHDIDLLSMVRKLKDKGLQLKAIRNYIDNRERQLKLAAENKDDIDDGQALKNDKDKKDEKSERRMEFLPVKKDTDLMSNAEKLEQFQRIMNRILSNAIAENNELIGRVAGEHAATAMVDQMQGMTKEQEMRAEERYRKLDQTLREIQLARKEAAAAGMRPIDKRRQQRLKRKNKSRFEQPEDKADDTLVDESVKVEITGKADTENLE